jgi:cysteinyl-tRNA synthetase
MLTFYNTLSRKKEVFEPIADKRVGIYCCGPTVYGFAHIGNWRAYIFSDTLLRTLHFNNLKTTFVMNITDVDDKTIRDSKMKYPDLEPMAALKKFTKEYEEIFWRDLAKLNIQKPDKIPHATELIGPMQELIVNILNSGYAYEKDGSFYFNVGKYSKDHQYGQLVALDLGQLKTGLRILSDEYEKEEVQDFVLWKASKPGEPSWDFAWQRKNYPGRPGWHIECSAMSHEYLSTPFDIHTGGVDLRFPHHENEIAQSVAGYRTEKLADFFLHNEHVLVDGQRMGKRFKNFYILADLTEKNFRPLSYRYLILTAHYRSKLNFTWKSLQAAQSALNRLYQVFGEYPENGKIEKNYKKEFEAAIYDDLDTPKALALAWKLTKDGQVSDADKKKTLLDFDKVFGLGLDMIEILEIPDEIKELADQREKLRQEKKWQEADEVRKKIEENGWQIQDSEQGPKIIKS